MRDYTNDELTSIWTDAVKITPDEHGQRDLPVDTSIVSVVINLEKETEQMMTIHGVWGFSSTNDEGGTPGSYTRTRDGKAATWEEWQSSLSVSQSPESTEAS
jgi:hypothetical protein